VEWPDTLILFACDHQVRFWSLSMIWLRSLSPMASGPSRNHCGSGNDFYFLLSLGYLTQQ
jgi:hypothetical protein